MVAPRDQRGTGRRAERRGVKIRVAQPTVRDAIQCRGRNDTTKGAWRAKAGIVRHDEQHVRRALRRHDARCPPCLGFRSLLPITPPNFGSGGGSCFPSIVVVAPGVPGTPVVTCAGTSADDSNSAQLASSKYLVAVPACCGTFSIDSLHQASWGSLHSGRMQSVARAYAAAR